MLMSFRSRVVKCHRLQRYFIGLVNVFTIPIETSNVTCLQQYFMKRNTEDVCCLRIGWIGKN